MKENVVYGDPSLAHLFDEHVGKYNDSVILTEEDTKRNTKILSKESNAQELYDMYNSHFNTAPALIAKDLTENMEYHVKATSLDIINKVIKTVVVGNGMPIYITYADYIGEPNDLLEDPNFKVSVIKEHGGVFYGSNKIYSEIDFFEEMHEYKEKEEWFDVKITDLVKGGYRALYKGLIKCFIPGSHAAANIITNFDELIGKTIPVMIDNYDKTSHLFVVSYKKYIKYSISEKIYDIEFGKKYMGTLTSKPTKYGLFVELENYYTGLIHATEFEDYELVQRKYKRGDKIEVFVKDIQFKDDTDIRILLTLHVGNINPDKAYWLNVKNNYIGIPLGYTYDEDTSVFTIQSVDDEDLLTLTIPYDNIKDMLDTSDKIMIDDINILSKDIKFDFVK